MGFVFAVPPAGGCIRQPLPPASSLFFAIKEPVGDTARGNLKSDVKRIQEALNVIADNDGGPSPALVPDGIAGRLTIGAIKKFQQRQLGSHDGRVDPGKRTVVRLNEMQASQLRPDIVPTIISLVGTALGVIRAAQSNLLLALPVADAGGGGGGGLPAFGRDALMRLSNLHFQVDRTPQPSATLRRILRIYDRMQQVFKRPGGVFGPAMFETNPFPDMEKIASAWTTAGGFDLIGHLRPRPEPAARADRIYLCSQVATRSRQANIMLIVHELAHFVGPPEGDPNTIDDNHIGGVWIDDPKMVALTPTQRLRTAQNYATFALDCGGIRPPGK
jgi:peptidoglycan hydrolase-like protein with peptidoglycan-binding domain